MSAGTGLIAVGWSFIEGGWCLGSFVLPFAIVLFLLILEGCRTALRPAVWADYRDALAMLETNPADPTFRQIALDIGREYSALSADLSQKPRYTEAMIQNDLQVACAEH